MTMLLCRKEDCWCPHHPMLYFLKQGKNDNATSLLQKIDNFNELADTSGRTLLHYAVDYWNKELMGYLIENGCNVNAQDTLGVSPLMLAINRGEKIIEILLKNDADVYATNRGGRSIFEQTFHSSRSISQSCGVSAVRTSICILEMIFERVNNDFSEGKLEQWLANTSDLVKLIVVTFGSGELTRFVLENGYPIDYHDKFTRGCTALHCAMLMARLENVKILIERGANVDALDEEGCSPLYYYTPNFDNLDMNSELLISLLRSSNDQCCAKSLERLLVSGKKSTEKTLLLSGIDVDACLANTNSTLMTCLIRNRNEGVFDLVDELHIEFEPNARTLDGNTALMESARLRYPKKVEFLLQHGADVNMTTSNGKSALMCVDISPMTSAQWQSDVTTIIELLLQYGADDSQCLFNYRTPPTNKISNPTRVIVTHLALLEAQKQSSLTNSSRIKIESKALLKTHFLLCTKQLEEMKDIRVYGTITLFKFLTETDEKIAAYARNQELTSSLNNALKNKSHLETYYLNFARIRLSKALDLAELQEKAALVIEALTGLNSNVYYAIVYKIISYMNRQDLKNLCDTEWYHPLSLK